MLKTTTIRTLALGALLGLAACDPAPSPRDSLPTNGGIALWARAASNGPSETSFKAATTDTLGNVYAVGSFFDAGPCVFGTDVVATGGVDSEQNLVLVKYDTEGTALWARTISAPETAGGSMFNAVTTDASGNVYAAGFLKGTEPFDFGNNVTAAGTASINVLLVKYDAAGTAQWARSGSSEGGFWALAADSAGNVYTAGVVNDNAMVAKYDDEGTEQWTRLVSTDEASGQSQFTALAVDVDSVYVAGNLLAIGHYTFGTTVSIEGTSTLAQGVLVKYDASGEAQWVAASDAPASVFSSVAADASGHVYVAGFAAGDASYNALLTQYNSEGTAVWSRSPVAATPGTTTFNAVAVDSWGRVYLAGSFYGAQTYQYGSHSVTGVVQANNAVLAQYDASGRARWIRTVSGHSSSRFTSLAIHSTNVFVTVDLNATDSFDFGNEVTAQGGAINANAVVVKYE